MYPQELIDEVVDYLHDWPSALKACSLVSRKFYPRTRVHLFRRVNCDDPKSAPIFDIARDSPELLQCVKHVELRCLDFFLPEHHTATVDFLHSLTFPVTLSVWDNSDMTDYSDDECEWRHILPAFVSSAPYGAVARLELNNPRWNTFLEFHDIVLSLPNVTELYISDLREMNTINDAFVPVSLTPRIKKMHVDVDWDTVLIFWEGLRSYRSVYLDHLEEFHVINCSLEELSSVVQTVNLAPKDLKVLEIDCHQLWHLTDIAGLPVSPSLPHLNTTADLRLSVELSDGTLPFINWWINSFKALEKDSPVIERLTLRLADAERSISSGQLEPLKRAFEELSDFLSKLVRNVDLVFQLQIYEAQPSPLASRFRNAIVDACEVLKEKSNLRVFDMDEYTYEVPVFPIP
ncbi:hypothetical protein ARMGADRAFT_1011214 [Armillaria gallica]|uniref:F-box domain-containing protein n=1 Tax=Armillaria gallica TaxID=47427 RepID=A0A2H3DV70_ARMGA|nr:hypothetical protein ARMGADRAFT_1011214 [Armillaria gallica]